MELAIFFFLAVEKEKRVYEERKVSNEGNVECSILVENLRGNNEYVGKVQVHIKRSFFHGSSLHHNGLTIKISPG